MQAISPDEASQTLAQVKKAQDEVTRRSAKDYAPWIGWGLFIVLFWPPFDFFNPAVWGVVTWVVAIAGSVLTSLYFGRRKAKIKSPKTSPKLAWFGYAAWIAVGSAIAIVGQSYFTYAWTVAGLVTGLPFVIYGLLLKNRM